MGPHSDVHLTRRERQIMDVLYRLGEATVAKVLENLPDPPSYSAVRAMLRLLEEKGHIKHQQRGVRYVYAPVKSRAKARRNALNHLVSTFFNGSAELAVAALLDMSDKELSDDELQRLAKMIEGARES